MNTMHDMNNLLLLPLFAVFFFFASCQNSYRQDVLVKPTGQGIVGVSDDAYQVTLEEYGNYFESRYGLLFQKFNDRPFTGRILTIEKGDSGDYVSADESWKEGKKDGISSRWFSNGIKMYERNYSEGRWHGTVTRWWPNGQKMYVRAYTNGSRHGKEATWRSDGSPIKLSEKPFITPLKSTPIKPVEAESQVTEIVSPIEPVDFPSTPPIPTEKSVDMPLEDKSAEPFPSLPSFGTEEATNALPEVTPPSEAFPVLPDMPVDSTPSIPSNDGFPLPPGADSLPSNNLPDFPSGDDPAFPELPTSNDPPTDPFPEFPPSEEGVPALPGLEPMTNDLPAFPDAPPVESDFPPLPGLPGDGGDDLPPLPGLPDDGSGGLPPLPGLPGDDLDGGLPPFPGADSPDGGLPPLPAFPE